MADKTPTTKVKKEDLSFKPNWDFTSFTKGMKLCKKKFLQGANTGLRKSAYELLRQSVKIVPHDIGTLQNSATVVENDETMLAQIKEGSVIVGSAPLTEDYKELKIEVGYHTDYAKRLHEHPEYNFKKGRQGKYLESPLKTLYAFFGSIIQKELKKLT